jgi:hypothetical protein
LCRVKHCLVAAIFRHRFLARAFEGTHGHDILLADLAFHNSSARLIDHNRIGRDVPADNGLTQPPGSVDHHLAACPGQWIRGEEDACCVSEHQALHDDRQAHVLGRDVMACTVADRPRRPQRSPATLDGIEHHRFTVHVEVGLLLASKRHLRQILGGGRGTHGDGHITPAKLGIRPPDRPGKFIRHRTLREELSDPVGCLFERPRLIGSGGRDSRQDLLLQPVLRHKTAIGRRGEMKTGRHGQAGRCQTRQRSAFPSHLR